MAKQGKKQRKYGRNSRSASGKNYTFIHKWEINKRRKIEKEAKIKLKNKNKVYKVPRGTARSRRRRTCIPVVMNLL